MNSQRKLAGLVLIGGLGALIGLNWWPQASMDGSTHLYAQQTADSLAAREQSIAGAEQLSSAFRGAAKAVRPSVVRINAKVKMTPRMRGNRMGRPQLPPGFPFFFDDQLFRQFPDSNESPQENEPQGEEGLQTAGVGSGVIVSRDGYVLTNNHVVQDADEIDVELSDGRHFTGKVIGTDDRSDVAVVKIDAKDLVPARLGDSSSMDVGDWVIAVGSPFELDQTVTAGIISATNRSGIAILDYEDFLQTDAAINPGNSGGPLVNLRGEVIGINTAINSRSGSNAGVGFAIPSNMASRIMESIIKNGRVVRGFIGASLEELTLDRAREAKLPDQYRSGAIIENLLDGGPAAKAGLQPGDIVVRMDGKPLRDRATLRTQVALTPVGQSIKLTIFRKGKELELAVRVEEQTGDKLAKLSGNVEIESWGITVGRITADMANRLGIEEGDGGVVVLSVARGGKGEQLKLQPGDIFMKLNGQDVTEPNQLRTLIQNAKSGIRATLRRGNYLLQLRVND